MGVNDKPSSANLDSNQCNTCIPDIKTRFMAFMLIYPTDNTDTNTSTRTEFWLSGLPGMKTCRALYQKMDSVDWSSYLITAAATWTVQHKTCLRLGSLLQSAM